jgi:transcriptional regulator with XRE-family HTH domain
VNELGEAFRSRRKELGLTLEALADRVGVTPGALSHVEGGRRLPDPNNALAIGEALGFTPDEILAMLDDAHSDRRATQVGLSRNAEFPSAPSSPAPQSRVYRAMPVEAMFDASMAHPGAVRRSVRSPRDRARFGTSSVDRVAALEELAEEASRAIRTLRGMLDDEDPGVAREARRLLRELDVRGSEE